MLPDISEVMHQHPLMQIHQQQLKGKHNLVFIQFPLSAEGFGVDGISLFALFVVFFSQLSASIKPGFDFLKISMPKAKITDCPRRSVNP